MRNMNKENQTFESIKHIDENGIEYWSARELMKILEYKQWRRFENVIDKAKQACENSDISAFEHFANVGKLSRRANNAEVEINDYKLTRYACYLIAQNGDPRKEVIALAQTYKGNYSLNKAAKNAGVKNFDKFHNAGYQGLYNGETADDIAKRKGLRYREDILDNMGSDELIANLFRISQTEQKLKRDNIQTEKEANKAHYEVGSKIRNTIKELGGTMPEDLPTPEKSLKQLEKENKKALKKS